MRSNGVLSFMVLTISINGTKSDARQGESIRTEIGFNSLVDCVHSGDGLFVF